MSDLPRAAARRALRRLRPDRHPTFRCNVCGRRSPVTPQTFQRELPSCAGCGSNARWRAVVHVLSSELFGGSLALPDFPRRRDISGVGMSDWAGYADPLARTLDYVNTFYHREPRLDICALDPALEARFDFVISSEVFEHVPPPVSLAFANLRRLLKPGGVAVFTVPYGLMERTDEHFPELHDYELVEEDGRRVLRNVTASGEVQVFDELVFHGGEGATLEMRMFAERDLLAEFRRAGFADAVVYREGYPAYGVGWPEPWSLPIAARAPAR